MVGAGPDIGACEAQSPILRLTAGGGSLVRSWGTNSPGYTLQSTATPGHPGSWAPVPGRVSAVGADFQSTQFSGPALMFYRLLGN